MGQGPVAGEDDLEKLLHMGVKARRMICSKMPA
jgi:hypothetical protein